MLAQGDGGGAAGDRRKWDLDTHRLAPWTACHWLKWVFKVKKDEHGAVVRYKARLVVKGYAQRQGVDYDEVFAPVARMEAVRLLLALAAQNGWEVHHMDVKMAFLNGEVWMWCSHSFFVVIFRALSWWISWSFLGPFSWRFGGGCMCEPFVVLFPLIPFPNP
jgi:hypothetical protein